MKFSRVQTDSALFGNRQEASLCLITWALAPIFVAVALLVGRVMDGGAFVVVLVGLVVLQGLTLVWYQSIKRRGGPNAHRMNPFRTVPAAVRYLRNE